MSKDRSINMNFGSYIKEIRESQNLTLRDVQEAVQISPSYLNRIERGEKKNPGATIDGLEADVKIKDAIVSLVKCIANLEWNQESKNREIGIVLQNVDNLKMYLR